ncbi:MAG: hypothetical protein ACYDCQ_12355 [Dehalococcoidia bacterium]
MTITDVRSEVRKKDLERDLAMEQRVVGAEHLTKATLAQEFEQFVPTEFGPDRRHCGLHH